MEELKVSVLLCVYNPVRSYFLQAVRSIVNQTMQEWELIIVDDGSSEEHRDVFREAAALDDRIRLIHKDENRGLAAAMNEAVSHAGARYLARMDADDISEPDRLRVQYDFLENHPEYQWAGSNTDLIDDNGRWGTRKLPEIPDTSDFLKYSPYIHPSVMFRAEVLHQCGGYHITRRGEDYELFMRLHAQGMRGYNIQEVLFSYRESMGTYRHRDFRSCVEEVRIRREGFRRLGMHSPLAAFSIIKPLFVAFVPYFLLVRIKKKARKEMYVERYSDSQTF